MRLIGGQDGLAAAFITDLQRLLARRMIIDKHQQPIHSLNPQFSPGKPEWFARGKLRIQRMDWLLVFVDNHPARKEALEVCDECGCQAILAANETHSSEACYYQRSWKGTKRDPRVYYPDIQTSRSGDPRAAAIGCTGEAQQNNRQLVSANFMAAALAEHLYVLWQMKAP